MPYISTVRCVCDECGCESRFRDMKEAKLNGWTFVGDFCLCENCEDSFGDYFQMADEVSCDNYLRGLEDGE